MGRIVVLIALACFVVVGCQKSGGAAVSDAPTRLSKVLNLYRFYVEKNQKGPPNEEALREFGQKLTPEERANRLIGDDLESIFTSPRDNQKFIVKFNMKPEPSKNQAVAWEATGKDGRHFVALTMGYFPEYDEEMLKQYTK